MNKLIFILFILASTSSKAQISEQNQSKHNILIGIRTEPVIWYEYGYMHIGKRFQTFQIKSSFAINLDFPSRRFIYTNYNNHNGYINFNSNYATIKPGYAIARVVGEKQNFYLIVNTLLGFSRNQLNINFNDPILGVHTESHSETNYYQSIELEANWHVKVNKNIALKFGPLIGKQLNSPILFANIYDGAFAKSERYKPGIGYYKDIYFAFNFGLAINLIRK
jgi:hypothetical protein